MNIFHECLKSRLDPKKRILGGILCWQMGLKESLTIQTFSYLIILAFFALPHFLSLWNTNFVVAIRHLIAYLTKWERENKIRSNELEMSQLRILFYIIRGNCARLPRENFVFCGLPLFFVCATADPFWIILFQIVVRRTVISSEMRRALVSNECKSFSFRLFPSCESYFVYFFYTT